jgi:hypothetical protein
MFLNSTKAIIKIYIIGRLFSIVHLILVFFDNTRYTN